MRDFPVTHVDTEPARFTVSQHHYDVNLMDGKWKVHLCSRSGKGVYTGPKGGYGTFQTLGKVCPDLMALPAIVAKILMEHGYGQ